MIRIAQIVLLAVFLVGISNDLAAQDVPLPVLGEVFRHIAEERPEVARERFIVSVRKFPSSVRAAQAARAAGFRVYEGSAEILTCAVETPQACELDGGDRVLRLRSFEMSGDSAVVGLFVSTFVRREDGTTRLFPVLRQLVLTRTNGSWLVIEDKVLVRG